MAIITTEALSNMLEGGDNLAKWVQDCADLMAPDHIHWCDGSQDEYDRLVEMMVADGTLIALNQTTWPGCYLHRSNPNDVARTEGLTFICTPNKEQVGITNNWMSINDAQERVLPLFENCMRGRTMYVVPYLMGTPGSPFAIAGVEITDSPYVVVSMRIMTRMGTVALDHINRSGTFMPGLHAVADCDPQRRYIVHFPQYGTVWSIGSGYGGNALLGKKCLSLRLASWQARNEGWLAEHMLILGLEDPSGEVNYISAAFPSACGKTNLAMLVSPDPDYKVWTVGDDIAWMRVGDDGRLWAMNPEAGFFGVAPGTNEQTNPNALQTIHRNTIFTNVALTPAGEPWWEGLTPDRPSGLIDWQGRPYDPENGPAAHPNSRFTAPARQCPAISPHWEDPQGVPISAILFGGRRARVMPLVVESFNWQHGVFMGATMASETTAAAEGKTGMVRRDPMAMLPFCGYNMADYFAHWLEMESNIPRPPRIYTVNWFRKNEDGFLWPGFGQNVRVLRWILERVQQRADAASTAIGMVPTRGALDFNGLSLSEETIQTLLSVDHDDWTNEARNIGLFLETFGSDLPDGIAAEHQRLVQRLNGTK